MASPVVVPSSNRVYDVWESSTEIEDDNCRPRTSTIVGVAPWLFLVALLMGIATAKERRRNRNSSGALIGTKVPDTNCHEHRWIDSEPKECGITMTVVALQGQDDSGLLEFKPNPNDD